MNSPAHRLCYPGTSPKRCSGAGFKQRVWGFTVFTHTASFSRWWGRVRQQENNATPERVISGDMPLLDSLRPGEPPGLAPGSTPGTAPRDFWHGICHWSPPFQAISRAACFLLGFCRFTNEGYGCPPVVTVWFVGTIKGGLKG